MIESAWNLRIEPRPCQSEASESALATGQDVCSLPTGTGKTLVAVLWLKSLFEAGKIKNALILEPTRLLVNQTSDYLFYKGKSELVISTGARLECNYNIREKGSVSKHLSLNTSNS